MFEILCTETGNYCNRKHALVLCWGSNWCSHNGQWDDHSAMHRHSSWCIRLFAQTIPWNKFSSLLPSDASKIYPTDDFFLLFQGEREIPRNGSIRFSPDVGFTLFLNKLEDAYGRYRCISDDEEESPENDERSVRINVLHGEHSHFRIKI